MSGDGDDGFLVEDHDRLPWLEPAEPLEDAGAVSFRKVLALVLLGLVLLGIIVGGGWWLKSTTQGSADGNVALIKPQGDNYKIPANSAEAKKYSVEGKAFEGEGDAAFTAREGGNSSGKIDASKAPEVPMTDIVKSEAAKPAPVKAAPAKPEAAPAKPGASPAKSPAAPAPAPAPEPEPSLGGARIQVGAYNSEAIAEEAWKRLVKRFDDLGNARHAVEPVVSGGKTLYRLRMGTADKAAATALCGRLSVAGERCFVVP